MARLAKSLERLRSQIDDAYPNRSKDDDEWIGDSAHAKRPSDHNPNDAGVVTALDVTHDPTSGCDAGKIANALRLSRDPRIKYVISNARIASEQKQWAWRPYTGTNPHTKHFHISVQPEKRAYDSTAIWKAIESPQPARIVSPPDDPGVEPDDTKPHAGDAGTSRTGITQGAQVAGGLGIAGILSQVWDSLSHAPETILQAVVAAAQKPAFWVFAAGIGAAGYIWWRRSQMKKSL